MAFLLLASACGDDDGDEAADTGGSGDDGGSGTSGEPATDEETCTEDRAGGDLTFGTLIPTQSLDPTVALGSGSAGAVELTALYDTLLRYNPEAGEFEPHVAESFEASDDLTEWTITLREGITFGNGDPLTTAAVQFSMDRMKEASVSSAQGANQIESMEIVDDRTIVFHLTGPVGDFAYVLAEDAGSIVNPAVVQAEGDNFGLNPAGAGVGPYEIERFAPGEEVVMTAKDDYWGGPVCIDTLRFVWVQGGQATYDAFNTGELDMAFITEPAVVAQARDDGVTGYGNVAGAHQNLYMNQGIAGEGAATSDLRVREAIAHALDLETLNERVARGEGIPTSLLLPPDSPIAGEGAEEIEYDPDLATELLDEYKAETGWDGSIRLLGGDTPEAQEMTITIEAMLEAVGLDVTVENVPQESLTERVVINPNFDLVLWGQSIFEESPMARLNAWESDSTRNRTGYGDPDMDQALEQLRMAVTRQDKREAMSEVQQVWTETVPSAVLFAREEFVATAEGVHGLVYSRDTVPMFHDTYVEE